MTKDSVLKFLCNNFAGTSNERASSTQGGDGLPVQARQL